MLADELGRTEQERVKSSYHYREYSGPKPPPLDHQGIDDAYLEKASYVLYYHRGKWLELQSAD